MERTYKQIELIGISEKGYEEAIQNAVAKASESLRGLSWFEVLEQRGRIAEGKVAEYQVIIKAAFKLD
jgi:flavin-binding protein dodecin